MASLTVPKWLPESEAWPRLWAATPRWDYFSADPDDFTRRYLSQLETYGPEPIARQLARIAKEAEANRLVLLCWEARAVNCHRSLFSGWWLSRVGEVIEEAD